MKEQHKQIVESYIRAYNNFDIDGMTNNLYENIVFENISNGKLDLRTEGLKNFVEQAQLAKQYFKLREQTIESWEYINTIVMINIGYKAVLAIDLPNGLKSGDTLELKGTSEFEFVKGKIIRITDKS